MVSLEADALARGVLVDGQVVVAHVGEPVGHVAGAVEARGPRGAAHAQVDAPPGQVQVLRDLAARLAGADHHHLPVGQRLGVAVLGGVQLDDRVGEALGATGDLRMVVAAGRHDNLVGGQLAGARLDLEAAALAARSAVTFTPSTSGASTNSAKPSRYSMISSLSMKPCGSSPA